MNKESTLNDYLNGNELNVVIYKQLKKNYPEVFETYLEFFSFLYLWYDFFETHQDDYYYLESEFDKIELEGLQRYVFLHYLIAVISYYHYDNHGEELFFSPVGKQSFSYIEEMCNKIESKFTPEEEPEPIPEPTPNKQVEILDDYNNSQLVLIFYYFLKNSGLEMRRDINVTTVARFIHLITNKDFSTIQNSEFNKKLQKAPNFKSDKELIKDLVLIKPLFQKVELNEIVKLIEAEIETAKQENKPAPK